MQDSHLYMILSVWNRVRFSLSVSPLHFTTTMRGYFKEKEVMAFESLEFSSIDLYYVHSGPKSEFCCCDIFEHCFLTRHIFFLQDMLSLL